MLFVRLRDDPKGPATTALFGDKWADTADMVGQLKSGRKDGSPETGHARPFVYRRRGLSISNGVLLEKELFRPVMGNVYAAELAELLPQCTRSKSSTLLKQLTIAIVL